MTKATFWVNKNGDGYFPLSPEINMSANETGCVTDITEALGEMYQDEKLLLDSYTGLDNRMKEQGIAYRFTTKLLENFEPKIIELTDEQYKKWNMNLKMLEVE